MNTLPQNQNESTENEFVYIPGVFDRHKWIPLASIFILSSVDFIYESFFHEQPRSDPPPAWSFLLFLALLLHFIYDIFFKEYPCKATFKWNEKSIEVIWKNIFGQATTKSYYGHEIAEIEYNNSIVIVSFVKRNAREKKLYISDFGSKKDRDTDAFITKIREHLGIANITSVGDGG